MEGDRYDWGCESKCDHLQHNGDSQSKLVESFPVYGVPADGINGTSGWCRPFISGWSSSVVENTPEHLPEQSTKVIKEVVVRNDGFYSEWYA